MMRRNVSYITARRLIKEGDILLFRHPGTIFSVGYWIAKYTHSPYSHVGIAHWDEDVLYCVEQREFKGGRSVGLYRQVQENPERIDVYRVMPTVEQHEVATPATAVTTKKRHFTPEIAKDVTKEALRMTGSPYGWKNIWSIVKGYLPVYRLIDERFKFDDTKEPEVCVCSTLVEYSYRKYYTDLCPFVNPNRTTPGDIARSALINYLFTLQA